MTDIDEAFKKALEHHRKGEYSRARSLYEKVIGDYPEREKALVLLGNVVYNMGDIKESLEYYRKAVEAAPGYAVAFFNIGFVLEELGRHDAAIDNYKRAIEINNDYAEAYTNLGRILKQEGDIDGAIRCFIKARELDEHHQASKEDLEDILNKVQEQVKARDILKRAEEFLKDGDSFESDGDLNMAISKYEKAVEIYPGHLIGHFLLGLALERKGDRKGATKSYEKILEIDVKTASGDVSRGVADIFLKRMGGIGLTDADFVSILERFRQSVDEASKGEGTISFLEYVESDVIQRPEDYLEKGAVCEASGDLEGAIKNYRKAVELVPSMPAPYYVLGLALEKNGEMDEAMKFYKKAIDLNMGFFTPEASREFSDILSKQIGNVYLKNMDPVKILQEFRTFVESTKGAPSLENFIRLTVSGEAEKKIKEGYLLDVSGSADEAISTYEKAIETDPNNLTAHYVLGLALEYRGEFDRAMKHYEESGRVDLDKSSKEVSSEVMEIIKNYLGMTTKDGHRVGTILHRYIEIIGEDPEKMLRLLSYIEDVKLDSISEIISSHMKTKTLEEGGGKIIRDMEDFKEDYEKERLRREKSRRLSKEKVELLWKYKTGRAIRGSRVSSNGDSIVGGSENGKIYLLDSGGELRQRVDIGVRITDVDVSPDGNYIGVCLKDGRIELYDSKNITKPIWKRDFLESGVTCIALSSRGEFTVIGTRDFQVILINRAGNIVWKHQTRGFCSDVDITEDGSKVVACTDTGEICIIENGEMTPRKEEFNVNDMLYTVGISLGGRHITAGSKQGNVYLIENEKVVWKNETRSHVYGIAISKGGEFVTAGTLSGMVYFYNKKGELLWKYPTGVNVWDVDISRSGDRVVAGCGLVFGNIYFFDSINSIED
jgi:tetratricopeptide (TPR) repeat protein